MKAVTSGVDNVEEALLSADCQNQLVPAGPRLIANKTKSFKTIDTEDVQKRSLAQEDGKIITEQKKTTEHEIIVDDELPEDDKSAVGQEDIKTIVRTAPYLEQNVLMHHYFTLYRRHIRGILNNAMNSTWIWSRMAKW